jgi:hypothetical protein
MKLSTRLSPEQSAFMRTITKTTENHVPLTYNGQQIGTCYVEMTSTGVQMVAEMDSAPTSGVVEIGKLPEPFMRQTEIKKTFKPERGKRR